MAKVGVRQRPAGELFYGGVYPEMQVLNILLRGCSAPRGVIRHHRRTVPKPRSADLQDIIVADPFINLVRDLDIILMDMIERKPPDHGVAKPTDPCLRAATRRNKHVSKMQIPLHVTLL